MAKFEITSTEWKLAFVFLAVGMVTSMRSFLSWLNALNSWQGLAVSYLGYAIVIMIVTHFVGLKIASLTIKGSAKQILGLLFITFSFFIITDFGESCWGDVVTHGKCDSPSLFRQTEDGTTYDLWSNLLPSFSPSILAFLTYAFTPFLLVLLGGLLVTEKQIKLFGG